MLAALAGFNGVLPAMAGEDASLSELEAALAQPVYGSNRFAGASKYDQEANNAPATVYVRTAGEIRSHGYRTLADVLESIPGIHLRDDRAYTSIGIRGFNVPGDYSSRLLILVDGARVNDAIYDAALGGREFVLDVGLIERVEFIAGPGSSLYGSNALLGVVNVITRGPSQLPGLVAGIEAGSGASRKLSATWGGELASTRLLLGMSSERRPGGDIYYPEYDVAPFNGVAQGRDAEAVDKLFAKARWGDATLLAAVSDRVKGIPTGSYGVVFNAVNDWRDRNGLVDLSFGRSIDEQQQVAARVGLGFYDFAAFNDSGTPGAPNVGYNRSSTRWWSGELRHVWLGWSGHRVLSAVEFQDNFRQQLITQEISGHSARQAALVNDEWQLQPSLVLNLGVRADHRLDGHDTVTPRLAALWAPDPDWTLKLIRGQAFREPNMYETRYADSTQRINPSLGAESLHSYEAAAVWRASARWNITASVYTFQMRNLLELRPQTDGLNAFENLGTLRSDGGELEATYASAEGLQWRTSWSRQNVTNPSGAHPPADAPRSLFKTLITRPAPWPGGQLAADLLHVGERRTLAQTRLDPTTRLNVHINHAPPQRAWRIGASVYNLTGATLRDPSGPEHVQDGLEHGSRELQAHAEWTF